MLATIWMCTHEWSLICEPDDRVDVRDVPPALELGVGVGALEHAAELAVSAVGKPDPHVLDRLGRREPRLADGVRGGRLLDPCLGLRVEGHASTGAAAASPWASRRRKYVTAMAIAPKGATTACAIVVPTKISQNSGSARERGLEERAAMTESSAGDDDDREHRPAVAANERARATERLEDAGLLDHDHGARSRPRS